MDRSTRLALTRAYLYAVEKVYFKKKFKIPNLKPVKQTDQVADVLTKEEKFLNTVSEHLLMQVEQIGEEAAEKDEEPPKIIEDLIKLNYHYTARFMILVNKRLGIKPDYLTVRQGDKIAILPGPEDY